jgi:hypothetical protein
MRAGQQLVKRLPRLLQLLDYRDTRLRAEVAMHAGIIGDAHDDIELRLTQGRAALISFDTGKSATSFAAAREMRPKSSKGSSFT